MHTPGQNKGVHFYYIGMSHLPPHPCHMKSHMMSLGFVTHVGPCGMMSALFILCMMKLGHMTHFAQSKITVHN